MWRWTFGPIRSSSAHCVARSIVIACWLFLVAYVTIPDYPYGVPLWQSLVLDANGYWHEVFYISIGAAALVFSSILWQALQAWRNVGILLGAWLERIEKDL